MYTCFGIVIELHSEATCVSSSAAHVSQGCGPNLCQKHIWAFLVI